MRWRRTQAGRRAATAVTAAAALMLAAFAVIAPVATAAGGGGGTGGDPLCIGIWTEFHFDGITPATVVRPISATEGYVVSIVVDLADFAHPDEEPQSGERVSVALGDTIVGTTPDLGDQEVRRAFTLPVGRSLSFDTATVRHVPNGEPDDLFVKTVCIVLGDAPTSTTTTGAPTTTDPTSTTTTDPATTTTTDPVTSTTTTEPGSSTTTEPGSSTSTTIAGPTSSTSVPDSSTTAPDPSLAPTTSTVVTSTVPTTIPGMGSFAADCTSGVTDAGTFVWTARASVPSVVVIGEPLVVSDQVWQVAIPAAVLENARQAGLVSLGDEIGVSIGATIAADGTVEASRGQSGLAASFTVTDAGDGTAAGADVAVAADDMTFTPTATRVEFRFADASLRIDLPGGALELACSFDPDQPPIVQTPPNEVAGPPPGELAVTGPNPLLLTAIVIFVLFDVGYLAWSATRPRRVTL
ncbi:MAG: hypothetical protein AAF081_12485 [Actinomycetota bacterium]